MSTTYTNYAGALKIRYPNAELQKLASDKIVLSKYVQEKGTKHNVGGLQADVPIRLSRSQSSGYLGLGANLFTAGNPVTQKLTVNYRWGYGTAQIDGQTIDAAKNNKDAFVESSKDLMDDIMTGLSRQRNRALFGYGNGILGVVQTSVTAGTSVIVKNPLGVAPPTGKGSVNTTKYIPDGGNIMFTTPAGVFRDANAVSSLSSDGVTIVMAANVTVTAGDLIVMGAASNSAVVADGGYANEPMGLLGHLDNGNNVSSYFGQARSSYALLKSTVIDATGGTLTRQLLQRVVDAVDQRSGGKIRVMFAHHSTRDQYLEQLQIQRRYVGELGKGLDAGIKGGAIDIGDSITYATIPIVVDHGCPTYTLFGFDPEHMHRYTMRDVSWDTTDGLQMIRVAGVDAFSFRVKVYENFAYLKPNTGFRIDNIAVDDNAIDITHYDY